jgi:hypothetical protein
VSSYKNNGNLVSKNLKAQPATHAHPSYLGLGAGDSRNPMLRKISHEENDFNAPKSFNANSESANQSGPRKTARISSPQEVIQQKKTGRKTAINEEEFNGENESGGGTSYNN